MGWATDIQACTTYASPPPEGSLQGARSPAPDSGFPAMGAPDFLTGAIDRPSKRVPFAYSIAARTYSSVTLNHDDTTWYRQIIVGPSQPSAQSPSYVGCHGAEFRPPGQGTDVMWRCESRS